LGKGVQPPTAPRKVEKARLEAGAIGWANDGQNEQYVTMRTQ